MTFDEVLQETATLSQAIVTSGFRPELLVGLARGGWIPTRLLSRALGVKEIISIGLKYSDSRRTLLTTYSTPAPMPLGRRLLLIEDCLESGKSLDVAKEVFVTAGNDVRTAALFVTTGTLYLPDFYNKVLDAPPAFPWE